jgi:hypothetical protein
VVLQVVVEVTFTVGLGADAGSLDMPFAREWPAWAVPVEAVGAWLVLQLALATAARAPACRRDPETWWSTAATAVGAERQAAAVQGCAWCPVLEPCRAYAIAAGERHGVWGGMTSAERRGSGAPS